MDLANDAKPMSPGWDGYREGQDDSHPASRITGIHERKFVLRAACSLVNEFTNDDDLIERKNRSGGPTEGREVFKELLDLILLGLRFHFVIGVPPNPRVSPLLWCHDNLEFSPMSESELPNPFESVYAGYFIFKLGFISGQRIDPTEDRPGVDCSGQSISLFAQNPGDQLIGDLVYGTRGHKTIIEFKRNEASVRSEFAKEPKAQLLRSLQSAEQNGLREFTDRGHFVVYGQANRDMANMAAMPYSRIVDGPRQPYSRWKLDEFLPKIMKPGFGFNDDEFKSYVGFLRSLHGASKLAGAAAVAGGGAALGHWALSALVMNYDNATKQLTVFMVDLINGLERPLERSIEPPLQQITREIPPDLTPREPTHEHQRASGRSRKGPEIER
jgi:hypothetical protein